VVISICPEALIYLRRDTPPTAMIFSSIRTDRDQFTNRLLHQVAAPEHADEAPVGPGDHGQGP
jgi:hypothetical protein